MQRVPRTGSIMLAMIVVTVGRTAIWGTLHEDPPSQNGAYDYDATAGLLAYGSVSVVLPSRCTASVALGDGDSPFTVAGTATEFA